MSDEGSRYEGRGDAGSPPWTTQPDGSVQHSKLAGVIQLAEWYWSSADAAAGSHAQSIGDSGHSVWSSCNLERVELGGYCGECRSCLEHGRRSSGASAWRRSTALRSRGIVEAALRNMVSVHAAYMRLHFTPRRWEVNPPARAKGSTSEPTSWATLLAQRLRMVGLAQPLVGMAAVTVRARGAWRVEEARHRKVGRDEFPHLHQIVGFMERAAAFGQTKLLDDVREEAWGLLAVALASFERETGILKAAAAEEREAARQRRLSSLEGVIAGDVGRAASVRLGPRRG